MHAAAAQPMIDPREAERLRGVMATIVSGLQREAADRVAKRNLIEKRWLEDLRQLEGEYEDKIKKELDAAGKSTLFINETRPKTGACEARLSDMLFPTDDRNWGISPTAVPDLEKQAKEGIDRAKLMATAANNALAAGEPQAAEVSVAEGNAAAETVAKLKAEMAEARKRATAMADEIEDQLTECAYSSQARDVIRDACRVGTGVMKGPVASTDRVRRSWRQQQVTDEATGTLTNIYVLDIVENPRPAYYRVDYWNFFPESDARCIQESASNFERHLLTKKGLRDLAKQPGFDKDAIRRLLRTEATEPLPTYFNELRAITGENQAAQESRYQVWEYRGPLTTEQMRDLCVCLGKSDWVDKYAPEDIDPLIEINVVLWFCQDEVLKFGIHHLDSGESLYSVYNLEKDDSSIWGYGIPALMRDPQKALNGAWRMMMDNGGLSAGGLIEIDRNILEPADGNWKLYGRKILLRREGAPADKLGVKVHTIQSSQPECGNIIALAKQFMDDVTNITILAQGEQGAHTTKTQGGMALLMNAVNVVFRRFVKNFDDDVTVPNIRRLYDWNMQFSPKEHIKGDYEVDARGSSVLLVREVQSQNLLVMANLTSHPVLGILLKAAPVLRKLAQSMMISPDEVVSSDEEIRAAVEAQQGKPQEPPPEIMVKLKEIEAKVAIADADRQSEERLAAMNRDTEMMKLAQQHNITLDELRAKLNITEMESRTKVITAKLADASKERILAAEIAVETRNAERPGEAEPPGGSGGYISA